MKPFLLLMLSLPILAVEGAAADWLVDHDVRATLSVLPRSYDVNLKISPSRDSFSDSGTFDSAGSFAMDYQASLRKNDGPVSLLLGGGLDLIGMKEKDSYVKSTVDGVGLHGTIGGSCRLTSMFRVEGAVELGFGAASSSIEDEDISLKSNYGDYSMIGVFFRPVVTFKPGFQLFGQIGYVGYKFNTTYDETSAANKVNQTTNIKGTTYGLGVGWRF